MADDRGVSHVHLSLSHDGGIATAFVVIEGRERPATEGPIA